MDPEKTPTHSVTPNVSGDTKIVIGGDVSGNVIVGNNNTVIQKIINFIFPSNAETTDQRNRRIMLGHVENFWVKGILEKSLHGAALLDLGIKEDPDALKFPWAIKREANQETLPVGTSMLEIFQEIGLGRSLLILGAPGSGKTTMLLELARQLIERAYQDVTEPIPVVFNLASWTGKLTLADWLARELNVIYTIPKKTAPGWIKENKMLLLLDGLDEVRQESRDNCVNAINQFRKENGLTSLVVCSRIQDYVDLKTRLAFDGAIEIQPLTSDQVDEYFKHFGKGLAGIRQALEKDNVLREMTETPLFLSIMMLVYQGKPGDIFESENLDTIEIRRKHLFDAYIQKMFERVAHTKNDFYTSEQIKHWLTWLAQRISEQDQSIFLLEWMDRNWLQVRAQQNLHKYINELFIDVVSVLICTFSGFVIGRLQGQPFWGMVIGISLGLFTMLPWHFWSDGGAFSKPTELLKWSWNSVRYGVFTGLFSGMITWIILWLLSGWNTKNANFGAIVAGMIAILLSIAFGGLQKLELETKTFPNQGIHQSLRNSILAVLFVSISWWLVSGLIIWLAFDNDSWLIISLVIGLIGGLIAGIFFGGYSIIYHYTLRFLLFQNGYMPLNYVRFLDYCTDLIFLRRVGGGYIFVHRLLMEHFAAMHTEEPK